MLSYSTVWVNEGILLVVRVTLYYQTNLLLLLSRVCILDAATAVADNTTYSKNFVFKTRGFHSNKQKSVSTRIVYHAIIY